MSKGPTPLPGSVFSHGTSDCRDAEKTQQIGDQLSDLLVRRGSDQATAVFAAQVALACFQTARRLSNNPHTLADDTRAAFSRALTLGAGSTKPPHPAPAPP